MFNRIRSFIPKLPTITEVKEDITGVIETKEQPQKQLFGRDHIELWNEWFVVNPKVPTDSLAGRESSTVRSPTDKSINNKQLTNNIKK